MEAGATNGSRKSRRLEKGFSQTPASHGNKRPRPPCKETFALRTCDSGLSSARRAGRWEKCFCRLSSASAERSARAGSLHALNHDALRGPINTVAPAPVTNAEFTQALGQAISRPTIFPLPAFAAKLVMGEMADEQLLTSQRVDPAVIALFAI
jgi:hypothetical protein